MNRFISINFPRSWATSLLLQASEAKMDRGLAKVAAILDGFAPWFEDHPDTVPLHHSASVH